MAVPQIQTALSAGEISPELYGEVNLAKYAAAATTIRNMVVNYKGGAFSRGGLAFVGRCKQNPPIPPRAIPFQFSITQGYILEFGDNYLRFVFMGGYVLESPVAISGISQAVPGVVSLTGTPFNNGDWVFVSGVQGMTQVNGQTFVASGVGSGTLQLNDLYGNPLDTTVFNAYTSAGTLSRIYTVVTPYAAIDLPYLKFSQSADVMSLSLSNPMTGNEYPPYNLTRFAADDWTMTEVSFDPVIAAPTSVSASANAQAPTNGINATFAYQVTAVDSNGNQSVASTTATCHGADLEVEAGTNAITWAAVAGAKFYNVFRAPASVDTGTGSSAMPNPVPAGSIFGFVGSSYGTQFADTQSVVDLTLTPPTHQNPFAPGQILAVDPTSSGSGQTALTYTITTAAGVDFVGDPLLIGGSLGGFLIEDPGSLFQPGDTIAFNGAGFASGSIHFGANPTNLDTITLNGVVWTFVTTVTGPQQTMIAGATAGTLAALVSNLSASPNGSLTVASYAADASNAYLLITYNTAGTGGNAYALASSNGSNAVSGATLAGGSGTGFAGAHAMGSLTFGGGNPTNTQTIVLDGVTWTFVTSGATGNETNISAINLADTLTQLQLDLTASTNAAILLANYAVTATALDISYKTVGTGGNSYTLGAGTTGSTPSAATLTGGTDASTTPTATLVVGPASGTYPGVNTYFQQRHFFANSLNNPDTLWASQTGLYANFDTSVPTRATDAITASPWTEQVDGIQWMIPMPGGLVTFTGSRAWQVLGEGSYQLNAAAITPATVQAQPQAFNGCSATVPPIVIDYDVLYVEAIGNTTVRDLSWNFWVNIYTGTDLTILSSHLFLFRQIVQWTWARNPYKVLWACCNDGTLLSMTYLKEQEVYGWARHDTQGLVVSIASVSEPPVNAVYVITLRFPPGAQIPHGITTYTMEARENYTPDIVADFATLWAAGTSQMYAGLSFDRVRRKILYCANPVPLGGQVGAPTTGTLVGGSGYDDGDYPGERMTGGSGSGATCDLTISGGIVTACVPDGNGSGYLVTDVLSAHAGLGGGTGFTFTLTGVSAGNQNTTGFALWTGQQLIANGDFYDGTILKNHSTMQKDIATDAVTRFDAWSSTAIVPLGAGGGGPLTGSISAAGTVYTPGTYFSVPLTGGSGYGAYADITVGGGGTVTVVAPSGGHAYLVGDVLSANNLYMDGTGSGFQWTVNTISAGSDGTWRRAVAANAVFTNGYSSVNVPRFVDPRTGDVWAHHEADGPATCEIYLLRNSDSYKQIISPLLPIPGGGVHMQPMALTANYLWVLNQQNLTGNSYLLGTPRTITAAETTADYLLPYPWFTWPYEDWTSDASTQWASTCCVDLSNNLYFLNWNYDSAGITRTYTLKKFTEPSAATPYNAATVGGGFTDITPWGGSTGPNTGLPANGTVNNWLEDNVVSKTSLMYLPTSNNLVAITKIFCVDLKQTWNSTNQANTHFDCTYVDLAGGTFDYHANWLTGFLDANLAPTVLATAAWALIDFLEVDTDLNLQSYDFTSTGVDYTKRWFFLALSPVTGGVWTHPSQDFDPTNRTCLIQVQFVPGSAPTILQKIFDTGWNTAYAAFGTTIGNANVVTATAVNSLNSTSFFTLDSGFYDALTSSWWWSGQANGGPMFDLNPAFASRQTAGTGAVGVSPPFLRLTLGSGGAPGGFGAYMMERMDNRLWQDVEDSYAVDAGISNPMPAPSAALFASANTGASIQFTATANVFNSASVGQILRMSGGIATVTNFLSPTQIKGTWLLNASNGVTGAPYAAAGTWTIAQPVTTLYAPHLAGLGGLVGLGDGIPFGPLAVDADQIGTVTLPFTASDVKIGLPFLPQLQSPYLNGQQATQGGRKVIPAATFRLASSGPFQAGTNQPDGGAQNPQQLGPTWTPMTPSNFANMTGGQSPPLTYLAPCGLAVTQLWTGDFRQAGSGAAWDSKGQVAIQQSLPLALEVVAIMPEVQPGDLPDTTYRPRQDQGGGPQQQARGPGRWMLGGPKI